MNSEALTETESNSNSIHKTIKKAVPIPVNAIGGLNKNNIDVLAGMLDLGVESGPINHAFDLNGKYATTV